MSGKPSWPPVGSCVAHRGAAGTTPENTVLSAAAALRQGAGIVEIDLQRSADGELIVVHDGTLARTTNIAEVWPERAGSPVGGFTLAELRKLDAGTWFAPRWRDAVLPTLAEMLAAVTPAATLFIELKGPERYPGIVDELIVELRRCVGARLGGPEVPVAIQTKEPELLAELHAALPGVPVCLMSGICPPVPLETLAGVSDWISAYIPMGRDVPAGYIEAAHGFGMRVCPWTIDAPEAVAAMSALGADAVVTNYVSEVAPLLRGESGPLPRAPLMISSVDVAAERFTVRNVSSAPVELAGWCTRNQLMVRAPLPAGPLAPGGTLDVSSATDHYLDNYGQNLALHDPADAVVDLHDYRIPAPR